MAPFYLDQRCRVPLREPLQQVRLGDYGALFRLGWLRL